jgi:hypothetical protein
MQNLWDVLVLKEIATAATLNNMHFGKKPVFQKLYFISRRSLNKSMRSANGCIWWADSCF